MSGLIPTGYEAIDFHGVQFIVPPDIRARVQSVWVSAYPVRHPDEKKVRRVLDIGAGCGEFAVWAWRRWPNCWIDCIESDPTERKALYENAPPGAKVIDVPGMRELGDGHEALRSWATPIRNAINEGAYDVVRIAKDRFWLEIFGDTLVSKISIVDIKEWI